MNDKKITLDEIANLLNFSKKCICDKCRELGFTKNGVKTLLNEKQFEELRKILVPRTTSQVNLIGSKIQTSISIKENFLKATQAYIALIEQEKKQLEEENKTNKAIIEQKTQENANLILINNNIRKQNNLLIEQNNKKLKTKKAWSCIEKTIKYIAELLQIIIEDNPTIKTKLKEFTL